jgi:hypothetical protein
LRLGLVGDVKPKLSHAAPARDLFVSPVFRARRSYVERSCDLWFILSSTHGLLHPDQVVEPYLKTITGASMPVKVKWSARVLWQLDHAWDGWRDTIVEIHAGADYRSFGLTEGLYDRGARVEVPTEHLSGGAQLAFYRGELGVGPA